MHRSEVFKEAFQRGRIGMNARIKWALLTMGAVLSENYIRTYW